MDPEARALAIAAKQHFVIGHQQALGVEMSARTIARRVEQRRWTEMHRGVYLTAGDVGPAQRVAAAVLACGPDAAASFDSAAFVWSVAETVEAVHVSVPNGTIRSHDGIVVHRPRTSERTTHRAFSVTPPMRTLLDLSSVWPDERIDVAFDAMHRRGLIGLERLGRYLEDKRGPGAALLRELIRVRDPGRPVGSELESIFFALLRRVGLPMPIPQYLVTTRDGPKYIDFAYPDAKLAIEVDGFEKYASRSALDLDRARQNEIEELGFHFRRFTWTMLTTQPVDVAFTVGRALGLSPVKWR